MPAATSRCGIAVAVPLSGRSSWKAAYSLVGLQGPHLALHVITIIAAALRGSARSCPGSMRRAGGRLTAGTRRATPAGDSSLAGISTRCSSLPRASPASSSTPAGLDLMNTQVKNLLESAWPWRSSQCRGFCPRARTAGSKRAGGLGSTVADVGTEPGTSLGWHWRRCSTAPGLCARGNCRARLAFENCKSRLFCGRLANAFHRTGFAAPLGAYDRA